jgi:hypothetical protein
VAGRARSQRRGAIVGRWVGVARVLTHEVAQCFPGVVSAVQGWGVRAEAAFRDHVPQCLQGVSRTAPTEAWGTTSPEL